MSQMKKTKAKKSGFSQHCLEFRSFDLMGEDNKIPSIYCTVISAHPEHCTSHITHRISHIVEVFGVSVEFFDTL